MKEESDYNKDTLLTIVDSETENAVATNSETEDDSETKNIVESRKIFSSSHSMGLDINMGFKEDSLQENSQEDYDVEGSAKPYDLNEALHTKEESEYNEDTSLTNANSVTESAVAKYSGKEDELENNKRVQSRKELPCPLSMKLNMDMALDKKDSLQENLHVSSHSTRRKICNSNKSSLRELLSDCGNLVIHPQQSQLSAGKWLCPRTYKKHYKPPLKQLSLVRSLSKPK